MATAKLSGIVTAIAGSIGGVTFRRHRSTTVLSSKSIGAAKSTTLLNPRLAALRTLNTNWALLSVATRTAWADDALLFVFPDKFGVDRNLSGRELYLKLQGNLIVTGGAALDPTTLASAISVGVAPVLYIQKLLLPPPADVVTATVTFSAAIADTRVLIQVEVLKGYQIGPTFTRRKIIRSQLMTTTNVIDFSVALGSYLPNLLAGNIVRVYVTYQNLSGFRSVPIVLETAVSA